MGSYNSSTNRLFGINWSFSSNHTFCLCCYYRCKYNSLMYISNCRHLVFNYCIYWGNNLWSSFSSNSDWNCLGKLHWRYICRNSSCPNNFNYLMQLMRIWQLIVSIFNWNNMRLDSSRMLLDV